MLHRRLGTPQTRDRGYHLAVEVYQTGLVPLAERISEPGRDQPAGFCARRPRCRVLALLEDRTPWRALVVYFPDPCWPPQAKHHKSAG